VTRRPLRQFLALAGESVRDAVRRRIAVALAALSLLALLAVDSCTSCGAGSFVVDGRALDASALLGWTGMVLYALLALWTVALAGALASDHLEQTLADGSALLALARPVGRGTFALARLAGALAVSFGTGALLLAGTAFFLRARHGLALGPAALGAACAALSAVAVGALAMTASLVLPRLATIALVFAGVLGVAVANVAGLGGAELSPIWDALHRFGPPIGSGLALAVSAWTGRELPASPGLVLARLALWATFAPALLTVVFRRVDLGRMRQ
jgi:ABC-type transport system involved in multi-copper enzyme maturation permease subunit